MVWREIYEGIREIITAGPSKTSRAANIKRAREILAGGPGGLTDYARAKKAIHDAIKHGRELIESSN
jgi:hypothetical protein